MTSWSHCPLCMNVFDPRWNVRGDKKEKCEANGWELNIDIVHEQFKSTWSKIWHLMVFNRPKTYVMCIWNPITHFLFITLGSTQQEYLKSQIMLRPSSWKACEVGKFMVLGKAMVSPHCWQWQKAVHDHHVAPVVTCALNPKWHPWWNLRSRYQIICQLQQIKWCYVNPHPQ